MKYVSGAWALFGNFRASLRESKSSCRESLKLAQSIDRLVVNVRRFGLLSRSFAVMISTSVFGFLMQKASEGWLAPGKIHMGHVWTLAAASFLLGMLTLTYTAYVKRRSMEFEDRITQILDDREVEKMVSLDVGRVTDPQFVELRINARRKGRYAYQKLWEERYELWSYVLAVATSFALIAALDFWILIIMAVPLLPGMLKSILMDKKMRELNEALVHPERVRDEYGWCLKDATMSVQSKLFGFVAYYMAKYLGARDEIMGKRFELHRFNQKVDTLMGVLNKICFAAVLVYLGASVVHGRYDLLKLFTMFGSARTFSMGLSRISSQLTYVANMHSEYLYLKGVFETKPLLDESGCETVRYTKPPEIQVIDVRMKYPRQDQYALRGCSLVIEPGSHVIVVGKNGCGKTSLLRLIAKVYAPSEGEVLYDGVDLRTIMQESLLKSVMFVTQGNRIADFQIDEAVTGCDRSEIDYDRLAAAARMVGVDEFVRKLEFGYQTQIGVEWPGGIDLSTGQMQRLKLVSAFYRLLDPAVHIGLFDEPMANCDAETRELFYSTLSNPALRGKTIVVVAHDPLYLRHFPRVVVMDDGRVIHDIRSADQILKYQERIALSLSADL